MDANLLATKIDIDITSLIFSDDVPMDPEDARSLGGQRAKPCAFKHGPVSPDTDEKRWLMCGSFAPANADADLQHANTASLEIKRVVKNYLFDWSDSFPFSPANIKDVDQDFLLQGLKAVTPTKRAEGQDPLFKRQLLLSALRKLIWLRWQIASGDNMPVMAFGGVIPQQELQCFMDLDIVSQPEPGQFIQRAGLRVSQRLFMDIPCIIVDHMRHASHHTWGPRYEAVDLFCRQYHVLACLNRRVKSTPIDFVSLQDLMDEDIVAQCNMTSKVLTFLELDSNGFDVHCKSIYQARWTVQHLNMVASAV